MKDIEEDVRVIRKYLLGELSDEERERIEEQVITDSAYRERVSLAEDELVEDYAAGALPAGERDRFLRHYLSAPRQFTKLRFITSLQKHSALDVSAHSPPADATHPGASWWRALLAFYRGPRRRVRLSFAVVIVVALVGAALLFRAWQRREQPNVTRAELIRLNRQSPAPPPDAWASSPGVLSLSLTPLLFRGEGETKRAALNPSTELVVLQLEVPAREYRSYRTVLQSQDGREVFALEDLNAGSVGGRRVLILRVPVKLLPRGDYLVRLSGLTADDTYEKVGDYSFRVTRQQ